MLDCFKKDYSKPSKEYGSHGEGEDFKPVWGFINPHLKSAQGASNPNNKVSEYQYGVLMSKHHSYPVEYRDDGGVYGAAKRLKKDHQVTASVENHKNAYNKQVNGAEILVIRGDNLSIYYAEMILDAFAIRYPKVNIRGVKKISKGGRGYNNLVSAKKAGMDVVLLTEMFFIDSYYIDPKLMAEFWKQTLS